MTNVPGVTLTLPSGTTFEFRGNISLQVEQASEWLLSGGGSVIGYAQELFEQAGGDSSGILKTPMATGYIGDGGSRVFEIAADNWEGETGQFGAANADDSVMEKLAVFENAVATERIDSLSPATLEWGPYSSTSSRYAPIPVVIPQLSPSVDFQDGPSVFRSRVTCAEAIDLSGAIDDGGISPTYELTPAGSSTPSVPLPADTLGAGGRGTGEQQQGRDVTRSGLVDVNNSTAAPTSTGTKVLPATLRLRGAFRGDGAAGLADTLKTEFLANDSVSEVDITAPGRSGATPLTGTYVLESASSIDPITPQVDGGVYGFSLVLSETEP